MTKFFAALPAPARLSTLAVLLTGIFLPSVALSADVVISQLYGGGGNAGSTYKNDFVELFNRGASPVNVAGWSVQYASASGTSWNVTPLPAMILQPGQYLLVQQAAGTGGTLALPTPDKSGSTAMSGTAGKMLLSRTTTAFTGSLPAGPALVDLVGFGSANAFEGTAPTPAPSNTNAVLRANGGCTDSDRNNADFTAGAPNPRNSASPFMSCGGPVVLPVVAMCPASLVVAAGDAGSAALSASDEDGIVGEASITSATVTGITLGAFAPASDVGDVARVNLEISPDATPGTHAVSVRFVNNSAESASCTISVNVKAPNPITYSIPQIQGSVGGSAYNNTVQTTEGVVTLKVATGFFMQDVNGDGDPSTSDGLFVYMGNKPVVAMPGDLVRVTGTVFEYTPGGATRSFTEIKDVSAMVSRGTGLSVAPTNAMLPTSTLDQLEGMLVSFAAPLTVSQTAHLGTRGELTLSSGRLEVPTNRYPAGSSEAQALAAENANNMLVLDDGIFVTPTTIPYIGENNTVRAGDSVSNLTGVIDFGAIGGGGAAFKLQPTSTPMFSRDNARTMAPEVASGKVKVASANVLNFFTTFTNGSNVAGQTGQGCNLGATNNKGNCRGADNLVEFIRQRDKVVAELKAIDADAFGLMEIQNDGDTSVSYLVESLNAAIGEPRYAVVPRPAATGTDAVRVAMIYKPSKLTLVGEALSDGDYLNNRPPMAQTFKDADGELFSLVVNHFRAKGSCGSATGGNVDSGDGQGCWNATRVQQAQRLTDVFLPQVVSASDDPDLLIIGDLNSYGAEDPIQYLTNYGLVNEIENFVRPVGMPYSYIFGGASGYLDHALTSASLTRQMAGVSEWHVNADEPTVLDYNTEGKTQDLYESSPFRAADHDPVVVSMNLHSSYKDISGSFTVSQLNDNFNPSKFIYKRMIKIRNTSGAWIDGPFQIKLRGLPEGVTLEHASGSHVGSPYITLDTHKFAPNQVATIQLSFSNPANVPISYSIKVVKGTFGR